MRRGRSEIIRIFGKILFACYIVFIVYFLVFSDWYGRGMQSQDYDYNLILFKEIKRFWEYRDQLGSAAVFTNLFGNVLIFVPFGFFMPMASRYRSFFGTVFWSAGLSLAVESFQLLAKVGRFDVDDLLLNTVGGAIGFILFALCSLIRRNNGREKR